MKTWYVTWSLAALFVLLCPEHPARAQRTRPKQPAPAPETGEKDGFQLSSLYHPGGLTADEAAQRAVRTSPTIASARASALVAESAASRAWTSVLPNLTVSGRYTRISDIQNSSFGAALTDEDIANLRALISDVDDPEARILHLINVDAQIQLSNLQFPIFLNRYGLNANLSYKVSDLFLRALPAYKGAKIYAEAQAVQVESQRQSVALEARQTFYSYARALGALAVAEAALEQSEAAERQVSARVSAGVVARVEASQVAARVASAKVAVERARSAVRAARAALRTLLHVDREEALRIGQDMTEPPPAVTQKSQRLVRRALTKRPELHTLRKLAQAREFEVTARAGGRWPQLSVEGNFDYANPNPLVIPQVAEWRHSWDISAVLSWSPNTALNAQYDMNEAEAELAKVRHDLTALEDAVRVEVTQAHSDYQAAKAAAAAATTGVDAAQQTYRVRSEQLRAGTAVSRDLIDAETALTQARLDLLDSAINLHVAYAKLQRAVGNRIAGVKW